MVKQVIVVRRDLKMRRGKEITQGSHSSIAFMTRRMKHIGNGTYTLDLTPAEQEWVEGAFTKITLQVENEQELLDIFRAAKDAGLEVQLIKDAGKTEFGGVPTLTCLAIGPDLCEKIDPVTKHLKLY